MGLKYCKTKCHKAGMQRNGAQKLYCTVCKKYQQTIYRYEVYKQDVKSITPKLLCEGVGVRGISRILKIPASTVISKIQQIAAEIPKPTIPMNRKSFEMDELRTFVGKKENEHWVAYALCSETEKVVDFTVGKRSKRVLRKVVSTLLLSGVKIIKTDELNIYRSLIPVERHIANAHNINHIERNNLNLRTHLKRLSRRTICFSKSCTMLEACLKVYFGNAIF